MLTEILLVLLLVAINGVFALSEIAVIGSARPRLTQLAAEGSAGAGRALELAADPTRFLSSIQVGISTIGILTGAFGEATLAARLRDYLRTVDALAPWAEPLSLVVVVAGITYVSLIIGELVPKRLALTSPERIASVIARPMQITSAIFRPVVHLLSVSTNAVLRLIGADRIESARVSMEEIKVLIEQGRAEGVIEPEEGRMMTNVLDLDERHVAEVMTPRPEVIWLDADDPFERNAGRLLAEPHDVLPLCRGGLQHVVGVIRSRRVLDELLAGRTVDLGALAEDPLFVPETMNLMRLLEELRRTGLPTAIVVDEFGDVAGVVSLTDVVEALVGELPAGETGETLALRRDDGSWLLDGGLDLTALARTLEDEGITREEDRHYHTLGGLAMAALGRVPRVGDVFQRGRYRFEVVDMDGNRVDRVLATPAGSQLE
ncbi:MAG TPA: hemolysin family protein [Vicinamibacterales bacterium]